MLVTQWTSPCSALVAAFAIPEGKAPKLPRRIAGGCGVREQGLGVDYRGARLREVGEPGNQVRLVAVVAEERAALDSPHRHVVQREGIEARLAG